MKFYADTDNITVQYFYLFFVICQFTNFQNNFDHSTQLVLVDLILFEYCEAGGIDEEVAVPGHGVDQECTAGNFAGTQVGTKSVGGPCSRVGEKDQLFFWLSI